ncbi:GntR family transcriptional regulator [Robertmurraya andreesenii]|uniref:DNA-binding transcriptional regulator YhcF (GntR family) n=1 Tax=Anoxybacillus andreesenii TaxID=1325932 RepID=A0ABT9V413_9BACL|nr:GntR family transcriptional regulator [Robertmurraya andreesenii]MDQ0155695.1 DNA-binding transcriptional regulator YhcF (GntR family) [Robertmurraya andreesenii]
MHYDTREEAATIFNHDGTKPIYMQIAEWLETEILNDHFKSDEKVYSQYQLAEMFTINPATAAKGLNLLADEKILYKKRGLGMFVTANAREAILMKRKSGTLKHLIQELVLEASRLQVSEGELIEMIKAARNEEGKE